MGTLELKWGPNGDPKTEKGPHGDRVPQMGTHVGTVLYLKKNISSGVILPQTPLQYPDCPDFHRPNGAKILRFGNFPETLTYLRSLENCQKSKSFSKIWLWKSRNFGYFLDRTRKPPHFQYFQYI